VQNEAGELIQQLHDAPGDKVR
jgi:hypothetical protein